MKKFCLLLLLPQLAIAQNFDSYFTGNPTDVVTQPKGGVCMMGGATEDDNAMTWFLEQANGGDVLVLRASGSDGYNDYMYSDLGVVLNSVETIVFNDASAANETYIHQKIEQAEAIWFAGGDQWNYISYWRDTPIDSLINKGIETRNMVIGGTSAGMAVLGGFYFTAENGTITSSEALSNPYAANATIDNAPFLNVPYMDYVITDTHYDSPDRRGRHTVFMGLINQDYSTMPYGIACEEYVAVCIDSSGMAHVYGGYPTYDEQAYFIRLDCGNLDTPTPPQVCSPGTPFTWSADYGALVAYKVNGTATGENVFNLNTWQGGTGGSWELWSAQDGVFTSETDPNYNCILSTDEWPIKNASVMVYPNPSELKLTVTSTSGAAIDSFYITDLTGRLFESTNINASEFVIETAHLQPGIYFLNYKTNEVWNVIRFQVK